MMVKPLRTQLSRREREIMDVVYALGEATVADVASRMHDRPSYDTVRVTLAILKKKGHLTHRRDGRRYVYRPTVAREKATRSALRNVVSTFFGGSSSQAILAMLDMHSEKLTPEEIEEIQALIDREKKS
jgi:predicted transcriptional regulator